MDSIPQKILILQLRRIGDVVFTLPVIGALRKNFPNAKIDFLVEPPSDSLVRLNPNINETLVYDKNKNIEWLFRVRKANYDCILDFHSNGRTLLLTFFSGAKIKIGLDGPPSRKIVYTQCVKTDRDKFIVEQKLDLVRSLTGNSIVHWNWDLKIPANETLRAKESLLKNGISNPKLIVGFAPLHRHPIRSWKKEAFATLAQELQKEFSATLLLLGGPGEETALKEIEQLIPERAHSITANSPLDLAALIQNCQLFIANDNGPDKIAMALKIPTLTLFGPTNPRAINLNSPPHYYLRNEDLPCIGCELKTCPYQHECMENLHATQVLKKVKSIFMELGIHSNYHA